MPMYDGRIYRIYQPSRSKSESSQDTKNKISIYRKTGKMISVLALRLSSQLIYELTRQ